MDLLFLTISGLISCYLLFALVEFVFGYASIKDLSKEALSAEPLPKVSIIFSALNEEETIRDSLLSLLQIDYPNLEIIAINDRSTDKTQEILDSLQKAHPDKLIVKSITSLPKGWFGKNHALYIGSQMARGDWLLFTDADVHMHPSTIKKAISYALRRKCDHLTAYELHVRKGSGLKLMFSGFYHWYSFALRPWRIRYGWSRKSLGRGAFNLIKSNVYHATGGHKAIAMECLDDLKLGKLIKAHGFRQDIVDAQNLLSVEWYASMKGMLHGWEKNGFAFFRFNLPIAFMSTLLAAFFLFWPIVGAFYPSEPVQLLNVMNIGLMVLTSACVNRKCRLSILYSFLYPIANSLIIFTIWNSVRETYKQKGIVWRETFYPLESLTDMKASGDK